MNLKIFFVLFFVLCGCAGDAHGPHKPVAAKANADSAGGGTGYDEVRPIFAKNCAACHPSKSGPNWLDYGQAKPYALSGRLKQRIVTEKSMPPPGSAQAGNITNEERAAIGKWADAGAPEVSRKKSSGGPDPAPAPAQAAGAVQQCLGCHGSNGQGSPGQAKIPKLAGQNEDYLYVQLNAFSWRTRRDPSNGMNEVAGTLSEEQMHEVARHFAGLPVFAPDASAQPAKQAMFEKGKTLAEQNCVSCHLNAEAPGWTASTEVPKLAGQSARYLTNQLISFRSKERENELMNEFAKSLSDEDIIALAHYFSNVSVNALSR